MISITCTQCQTVLTIDEAFAGGVCRCQHCGTIQTVPSRSKGTATPQPFVNPSSNKSKALYQNENTARTMGGTVAASSGSSPSGLDDLANAVASSSGLSGSGLHSGRLTPPTPAGTRQVGATEAPSVDRAVITPQGRKQKKTPIVPILIGGSVLLLALIGLLIYFFMFRGGSTTGTAPGGGPGTVAASGPTFCGEPLGGSKVIYLLDDANSISNDFDPLKAATYASIESLSSSTKFAVILWDNGTDEFAFPHDGMAPATKDQVESLRAKLQDTQATGASRLRSALDRAMARAPSTIVIVTEKESLSDDDKAAIDAAKDTAGGKVKFYAFTINASGENPALKKTADSTGAKYRNLSSQDLRAATP